MCSILFVVFVLGYFYVLHSPLTFLVLSCKTICNVEQAVHNRYFFPMLKNINVDVTIEVTLHLSRMNSLLFNALFNGDRWKLNSILRCGPQLNCARSIQKCMSWDSIAIRNRSLITYVFLNQTSTWMQVQQLAVSHKCMLREPFSEWIRQQFTINRSLWLHRLFFILSEWIVIIQAGFTIWGISAVELREVNNSAYSV